MTHLASSKPNNGREDRARMLDESPVGASGKIVRRVRAAV
jgi:hypothetical protein